MQLYINFEKRSLYNKVVKAQFEIDIVGLKRYLRVESSELIKLKVMKAEPVECYDNIRL